MPAELTASLQGRLAEATQSAAAHRRRHATAWALCAVMALSCLALTSCGTPTACLANRYDTYVPRYQCISGLQLPHDILKDTDPNSGSTAPLTVAQ